MGIVPVTPPAAIRPLGDARDDELGAQVGPAQAEHELGNSRLPQVEDLFDADAFAGAEQAEIVQAEQVDVGRIVPVVGQRLGYRHHARDQQGQAVADEGEIGKGHDALAGHAQHLAEHQLGLLHLLQGAVEHRVVEGAVPDQGQAVVRVALQHGHVLAQALHHVGQVDVDADAGHAVALVQAVDQQAVAAADVQDMAARFDQGSQRFHVARNLESCRAGSFPRFRSRPLAPVAARRPGPRRYRSRRHRPASPGTR